MGIRRHKEECEAQSAAASNEIRRLEQLVAGTARVRCRAEVYAVRQACQPCVCASCACVCVGCVEEREKAARTIEAEQRHTDEKLRQMRIEWQKSDVCRSIAVGSVVLLFS